MLVSSLGKPVCVGVCVCCVQLLTCTAYTCLSVDYISDTTFVL